MKQIDLVEIKDFQAQLNDKQFYANTISTHLLQNHKRIEKPHKHNFYATFLFIKGHGIHEIDYNSFEVKPGALFFLYPGQIHSWELSADCEGFLFFHTPDFFEKANAGSSLKDFPFFHSNFIQKCFYLDVEQSKEIQTLLESLISESEMSQWKYQQMIILYVHQLYIKIKRFLDHRKLSNFKEGKHYEKLFWEFEKLVEKLYKEEKSASAYANRLSISQKHLSRVVKHMAEKTPTQFITERVILEAQRLIHFSNLNFQEIANELGYEDYSYFTKIFKKETNETPTNFRVKYKKDGF
ncbi:MAG TPA: helix-turn-helix transcriptional regulator [Flavobacterium sp.]|nr:helix-turn-helix transcriptional regulator [Flavobacterium sp.]